MLICTVEILEEPTLSKPDDVETLEKYDAVFEARALGIPYPKIQWYWGSTLLSPSDRVELDRVGDTHRLILRSCEVEQTGAIRVTATNKAGELSEKAMLTVKGQY